jgi:hypothetical protein
MFLLARGGLLSAVDDAALRAIPVRSEQFTFWRLLSTYNELNQNRRGHGW